MHQPKPESRVLPHELGLTTLVDNAGEVPEIEYVPQLHTNSSSVDLVGPTDLVASPWPPLSPFHLVLHRLLFLTINDREAPSPLGIPSHTPLLPPRVNLQSPSSLIVSPLTWRFLSGSLQFTGSGVTQETHGPTLRLHASHPKPLDSPISLTAPLKLMPTSPPLPLSPRDPTSLTFQHPLSLHLPLTPWKPCGLLSFFPLLRPPFLGLIRRTNPCYRVESKKPASGPLVMTPRGQRGKARPCTATSFARWLWSS